MQLNGYVYLKALVSLLLLSSLALLGCSEETPVYVDFSKKAEHPLQQPKKTSIKYAYLPQYSHTVSYQRHNPLIEYLKAETKLNIEQVFPETFNEHILMTGEGKIDISYSNPVAYAEISSLYGATAFARVVEKDGKSEFRGLIIARSDNNAVTSLKDCKRWIAVDPYSAGGYIFALGHFKKHGIKKENFAEIVFAQGHGKSEKVVLAVHSGKYDCGSVREGTLEVIKDKINIKDIKVVAATDWYPGWVFAARKGLDPQVISSIKAAMLKLDTSDPAHKDILDAARIDRIISSDDREFDPVRRLLRVVGIDISKGNVQRPQSN